MGNTAAEPAPFDLSGGALCLDFVNTLGDRSRGNEEQFSGPPDLLRWSVEAGILDASRIERLEGQTRKNPRRTRTEFRGAILFREALYRIFSNLADGGRPDEADLSELNRVLAVALRHLRVEPEGEGFGWSWSESGKRLDDLLWPVARSAAELLTSPERVLVRECASDRCSWLFVDRSRTHRRRWCDMKVCGNRAKARRHYAKRKKLHDR